MDNELQIYIDGKFYPKSEAKVSVYDHGFLYGDGVFEGIRAYNGIVFKLTEHVDRLYRSAHAIMLNIPITKQEMIQAVLDTLRKNQMKDAYIRLVVSRGIGDLGLDPRKCPIASVIVITDIIQCKAATAQETGITTIFSWVNRNPVNATTHEIKSLNYLNSIMAKIEANAYGADEAMCLESNGYIAEGVGENVFIVKDGELFTPPTSTGALSGITAEVVVGIAAKLGIKVTVINLTPFMLFTADEAFFTGTAMEMTPIREVNKRIIGDGKPGLVTKKLMAEFQKVIVDPSQGTKI
ncbi:MAG: branched-chain-amino-acid transaminase [Nitrososphaerota archaeon]|jgi:branched-chain amino acid aminotransferase|nr:branched-chain-amino-acid transaminase [Nitrososphaerota archaeon]